MDPILLRFYTTATVTPTSSAATIWFLAVTEEVLATAYQKRFTLYQRDRELLSGIIVDLLNGCAGNIHISGTFLLSKIFIIDEANRFVFIYGHYDSIAGPEMHSCWRELGVYRHAAHLSPFFWSWHSSPPDRKDMGASSHVFEVLHLCYFRFNDIKRLL
ncbi:MAG: hypothetical protein SOY64_09745 [Pyramidobacter sp.]|nr:hypothetical protein [Pyramidobacter sp.]MDY4033321.1 hypothetical protein [Pyramidobacter sp.]